MDLVPAQKQERETQDPVQNFPRAAGQGLLLALFGVVGPKHSAHHLEHHQQKDHQPDKPMRVRAGHKMGVGNPGILRVDGGHPQGKGEHRKNGRCEVQSVVEFQPQTLKVLQPESKDGDRNSQGRKDCPGKRGAHAVRLPQASVARLNDKGHGGRGGSGGLGGFGWLGFGLGFGLGLGIFGVLIRGYYLGFRIGFRFELGLVGVLFRSNFFGFRFRFWFWFWLWLGFR
mmetsp:Transcript_16797/g.46105  ORF Transcript_16797/g.46105 Transcript_16797/m.46105 type:complete len:228 (-) Transcript_16797:886-1569(-)